ncbi:uncharacterized protein LOC116192417 [Punica granatum]|uniref:Uncharacterized protein n=2 Tax=Punica granatum TaxID=22663 RepID=A0A218VV40_PUNGR|nr:uncharacterized protein LOC116192417 [Punica granatum]OWM64139.1 hypothetical protein CDL15_Pgr018710 [Punica granatum]PKI57130.1 hypothetical protein CRG98_022420 [Punica granatum]
MSLNCLTCQCLQRTDSNGDYRSVKENCHSVCCLRAERNWSGPLLHPSYEPILDNSGPINGVAKKRQKALRRLSTGAVTFGGSDLGVGTGDLGSRQPKLIRSGGMRRDWSFEDLQQMRREGKRKERRQP